MEAMKDVISCENFPRGALAFDWEVSEWGNPRD